MHHSVRLILGNFRVWFIAGIKVCDVCLSFLKGQWNQGGSMGAGGGGGGGEPTTTQVTIPKDVSGIICPYY